MERGWGISVTHVPLLFLSQQSLLSAGICVSHGSNPLTVLLVRRVT